MSDFDVVDKVIKSSKYISGPWRCTIWKHPENLGPPTFIFSEEHGNTGACPKEKSISEIFQDILNKTKNTHVFIENFIHMNGIVNESGPQACSKPADNMALNDLRTCMEVIRSSNSDLEKRVHFVDPRVDLVAILPSGRVYEALDLYINKLSDDGNYTDILLTLYESFIHPLISLFPDNTSMTGRLSHDIIEEKKKMNSKQLAFFEKAWREDVLENISKVVNKLGSMKEKISSYTKYTIKSDVEELKIFYRDMTNKFLDTWLLSKLFSSENELDMELSIIYLGSLHSLKMESYFKEMGYDMGTILENKDLHACLSTI